MNYIGIDPSAETFTSAHFRDGKPTGKAHTFDNTPEGSAALIEGISSAGCERHNTWICIENTGVYSELLLYHLHQAGWPLVLIEPIKVHNAFGDDRPKTDEIDSVKIAEYAWRFRDKLSLWQPHEAITEQYGDYPSPKVLLTTREQIVKHKTALSNTRQSLGRKYIQTPAANSSVDTLIEQAKGQIKELEVEILRLIKAHPTMAATFSLLLSAPGVGPLLAAHLLVISDGFRKKLSYTQLARHLGIAPMPHRSGTSVYRKDRSRGKGPRIMRKLLHLAARSLVTHKDPFRYYYARKLAQGKPKKLVLNNVANRLLRIVCSMLKNNKPYIKEYVSVNPRLISS